MKETLLSLKERIKASRFFSGEKPSAYPITLNHRRIFILPSSRGLGFAALIGILLLLAFVYNNNLAYILTFLLAGVFFVAMLHSYKAMAGIIVKKGKYEPVFAGETAGFGIYLENPADFERVNLHLGAKSTDTIHLDIPANSKVQANLFSPVRSRGWYEPGTVTLVSYFPFGLFRTWSPVNLGYRILVYPKPAEVMLSYPETMADSNQQGQLKSGRDDFYGFQDYQPGDSIRQIHWKAYAKQQGLYSKQYSGNKSAEVWLKFDQAPGSDLEDRLSLMCRWVIDAEQSGIQYGFEMPGVRLMPNHGFEHYRKCLESLALF